MILFFKKIRKFPLAEKEPTRYISLAYFGRITDKIANAFHKANVKVDFRTKSKLGQILRHSVEPVPDKLSRAGLYKILCGSCNKFYIGQTGHDFKIRYREHGYASNRSALGDHLCECQHHLWNINDGLTILHVSNKGVSLDILEEIEIYISHQSCPDQLINVRLVGSRNWFFDCFHKYLMHGNV